MYKFLQLLLALYITVLVSHRGNARGVEEAKGDPTREVVERRKAVGTPRPTNRRDIEAINRRQAEIAAARISYGNYLQEGW